MEYFYIIFLLLKIVKKNEGKVILKALDLL